MDKERILTTEAQAKAVQEIGFLRQFFEPTSPSDAAKKLGQPANLVHHHAQRHLELGLLEEIGRENGKVLYQLTAQHFKVPRSLLPSGNADNKVARELSVIRKVFLGAYGRSDLLYRDDDPDYDHYGFTHEVGLTWQAEDYLESPEARPAHYQARTVELTPERYKKLVQQIGKLLEDIQKDINPLSGPCTFVFLGMDGVLQAGAEDSQFISTFVPPLKETA